MRTKGLLAAFLLGVGLCLMPALGYGRVREELEEMKITAMDFLLLKMTVRYMLANPSSYLAVDFQYDPSGMYASEFPGSIDTKGKICVAVRDTRDRFSHKYGRALLGQFKGSLDVICSYINDLATDMDTDIVAKFWSEEVIPLGYFYQGEYHLWEE